MLGYSDLEKYDPIGMNGTKKYSVNQDVIKSILTLRYNPYQKPALPKLTWENFSKKNIRFSSSYLQELIGNSIRNEIKNLENEKVAIALSAGIDSTLLLSILKKISPHTQIDAISVKFADSVDETPNVIKIAEKFGVDCHIMYIENFLSELPKAISIVKFPFWDLHWYYIAKKSKTLSKFLISGDGGDELFGGYTFRYKKFLSKINTNSTPLEKVKFYLDCHERDWIMDQKDLFGEKISFSWNSIYNILIPYFDNSLSPIDQVFLADYNGKLLYNFNPVSVRIHNHFRTKSVTPLLSKEIISYATHLSLDFKFDEKSDIGKIALQKLLAKFIDKNLLSKKKLGFSVNTINYWKSHGQELCNSYLSDARVIRDGLIDGDWVKHHLNTTKTDQDVRYVNKFLGILALEVWYRLFVTKDMKSSQKL